MVSQVLSRAVTVNIAQLILTVVIWGAIVYLTVSANDVPEVLYVAGGAIMSFWFTPQANGNYTSNK